MSKYAFRSEATEVASQDLPEVTLSMSRLIYEKLFYVAEQVAPMEVQFIGELGHRSRHRFEIVDVHLIKQTVTGASAEYDPEAFALFVATQPHPENLWLWVHSHVHMGVFWSSDDRSTISRFVNMSGKCMSVVLSLDGKMLGRMDVDVSSLLGGVEAAVRDILVLPDKVSVPVRVVVQDTLSSAEKAILKEQIEECVLQPKPVETEEDVLVYPDTPLLPMVKSKKAKKKAMRGPYDDF
jgi:hypothetical protein